MKKIFYLLIFTSLFSCEKLNLDAKNELSGSFKVIIDPLKCALPTTNEVNLKHKTGNAYELSYKDNRAGNQVLKNVIVSKKGDEKILSLNEKQIGIYKMDVYMDLGKKSIVQTEGYVLYLTADINGLNLEFMGKK